MQALILETFGTRIDQQIDRISRLESELTDLAKRRRALWIFADIDGQDVATDLDTVAARVAETEDLLDRARLGLAALYRRLDAATDEIALVRHRENCRAMEAANALTPKLERAYRKAASAYFDALAAMLGNVATQKRLASEIDRFAYGRDCETVSPELPNVRVAVQSDRALDYFTDGTAFDDNLSVSLSLSLSRFGYPLPDDRNVQALERVASWHK